MNDVRGWEIKAAPGTSGVEGAGTLVWLTRNAREAAEAPNHRFVATPLVPAPPEGAPTYAELVEALREVIDVGFPALSEDMKRRYNVPAIQVQLKGFSRARSLLSRMPKVEP